MLRVIVVLCFALIGCTEPSLTEKQKAEVSEIATDAAQDAAVDVYEQKIGELESRIETLESRLD
jgi:hypothetical protein